MKENPGSQTQNIRKGNIDEMIEKEINGNIQPLAVKFVEIIGEEINRNMLREIYGNKWKY